MILSGLICFRCLDALKPQFAFVSVFTLSKDTVTLLFTVFSQWHLTQSGSLASTPWKNELTEQGEIP